MRVLLLITCYICVAFADNVSMLKDYIKKEYTNTFPEIRIDGISLIVRNSLDIYNIEIINKSIGNNRTQNGFVNITYKYNNKIFHENIKYVMQASIALYVAGENISAKTNLSTSNIYQKIQDFSSITSAPATKRDILESSAKSYIPINSIIYKNRLAKRILIAKDSNVKIIFHEGNIEATSMGKAMENGTKGDVVKIENTESKRIINARVIQEGVVRAD